MSDLITNLNSIKNQKDSYIIPNNIRQNVTVLNVTGNLEPDKPDQTKTVTPSTSQQVVTPDTGYELGSVTVNPVTSSIDNNISPENIKKDVTILGVTGTLDGSEGLNDTVTDLENQVSTLTAALENKTAAPAEPNVYIQEDEPEDKNGIWLQSNTLTFDSVIADDNIIASEQWQSGNITTLPYAMLYGGSAYWDRCLYYWGSEDSGGTNKMIKYDIHTNTQTTYSSMAGSRITGVACNGYIYWNNGYKVDLSTMTKSSTTFNSYGNNPVMVTVGDKIYWMATTNNYVKVYNTLTNTLTDTSALPPVEFREVGGVADGTDILIFGSLTNGSKNKAYKFNTLTNSFTRLADAPYDLNNTTCVRVDKYVYIFGSNWNSKVCKYNINTNTYETLSDSPISGILIPAHYDDISGGIYLCSGKNVRKMQIIEKDYTNNSIIISQGLGHYKTKLIKSNIKNLKYFFLDAWHYTTANGLNKTTPTYYGDGTQWIKFKN